MRYNILNNCKKYKIFNKYANSKNVYYRSYVANTTNCPVNILEKLSNDENQYIRGYVANNKRCPSYVLEKLYNDKSKFVLYEALKNNNFPIYLQHKYVDNQFSIYKGEAFNEYDVDACWYIVKNKNCPFDILKKIYNKYKNIDHCWKRLIFEHPNWKLKDFE